MKKPGLSRRGFIKIALGTIGLGGLARYGMTTFDVYDFLNSTLERLLGKYNIADAQMRNFCNDFANSYGHKKLYKIILLEKSSTLDRIAEMLILPRVRRAVDKFERKLLTEFIVSTSYLQVGNPANDVIEYYGMDIPCNNPFAKFEFVHAGLPTVLWAPR